MLDIKEEVQLHTKLERLTTFEGLQVGDKVTTITFAGFKTFEFMGYDPRLANGKYRFNYAYFLDSFGRTKVERWYIDCLSKEEIYKGYDTLFVKIVELSLLRRRLLDLRKNIPLEECYPNQDDSLKLNLNDIRHIQQESDVVMGETLASTPADGLSLEEAFALYIAAMKWAEGDQFFRQGDDSDKPVEL